MQDYLMIEGKQEKEINRFVENSDRKAPSNFVGAFKIILIS